MKKFLIYLTSILLGLCVGSGSALWMSGLIGGQSPTKFFDLQINHWGSDSAIGSASANAYLRARVARFGLLALAKEEAIYFTRSVDDDGKALRENCVYEMAGESQNAYWWSITLYDNHSRLPMNDDEAMSIDATRVGNSDQWRAIISNTPPTNNTLWLSSRAASNFDVMLRLYRPAKTVLDNPAATLAAPSIKKLSCGEATA